MEVKPNSSLRAALVDKITSIELELIQAKEALAAFDALPDNNTFDDYELACATIEDKLCSLASNDCEGSYNYGDDCEGSYNYGDDTYEQEFIVNGKHYLGKLEVEFNRHYKTYYYVDETKFTVTEIN